MNYLFNYKYKKISGWIFYLLIPYEFPMKSLMVPYWFPICFGQNREAFAMLVQKFCRASRPDRGKRTANRSRDPGPRPFSVSFQQTWARLQAFLYPRSNNREVTLV